MAYVIRQFGAWAVHHDGRWVAEFADLKDAQAHAAALRSAAHK